VLTANIQYWAASVYGINPPFKQVFVNVVPNDSTEELDVRTGQANVILLPNAEFYDFADRGQWANGKLVDDVPGTSLWGPYAVPVVYDFYLNQAIHNQDGSLAKVQPFANADMRAAFNYAWNEQGFISNSLNGLGVPYVGLIFQGQLGYQTPSFPYPYNLTLAKQEIQKACASLGCSPSNPLTITIEAKNLPVLNAAAVTLAATVNSLNAGVDVTYSVGTAAGATSVFLAGTEGIQMGGLSGPYDPGVCALFCIANGVSGSARFIGLNDTAVNALLSQALSDGNATQRARLYQQANALLAQDGNIGPIAQVSNVFVTSSNVKVVHYASLISGTLPTIVELGPS
jgi:ABC-type transport system substrate-binding protein